MIAQRQKQLEDKIAAMGMTMEQLQRMGQGRRQQQ
jgi:DNA-binding Xre family transcriptional regulator